MAKPVYIDTFGWWMEAAGLPKGGVFSTNQDTVRAIQNAFDKDGMTKADYAKIMACFDGPMVSYLFVERAFPSTWYGTIQVFMTAHKNKLDYRGFWRLWHGWPKAAY